MAPKSTKKSKLIQSVLLYLDKWNKLEKESKPLIQEILAADKDENKNNTNLEQLCEELKLVTDNFEDIIVELQKLYVKLEAAEKLANLSSSFNQSLEISTSSSSNLTQDNGERGESIIDNMLIVNQKLKSQFELMITVREKIGLTHNFDQRVFLACLWLHAPACDDQFFNAVEFLKLHCRESIPSE